MQPKRRIPACHDAANRQPRPDRSGWARDRDFRPRGLTARAPVPLCERGPEQSDRCGWVSDRRHHQRDKPQRMGRPVYGLGMERGCLGPIAVLISHPGGCKLNGGDQYCEACHNGQPSESESDLPHPFRLQNRPDEGHEAHIIGCLNIAIKNDAGPHQPCPDQPGLPAGSTRSLERIEEQRQRAGRVQIEQIFCQRHHVTGTREYDRYDGGAAPRGGKSR